LHRELNGLKKLPVEQGGVPWMYEVSKCAPQEALRDLDAAFKRFFDKNAQYPRFKNKERTTRHFRLTGTIRVDERHIQLPRIGRVRIASGDRLYAPEGSYGQVSLVQEHGRWFASVLLEQCDSVEPPLRQSPAEVGIDLGVRKLATLSDGTFYDNPRALKKAAAKLRRAQKALSRSQRGSARRRKKRQRVARLHGRVANLRKDALHKTTSEIASRFELVALEELRVRNMTRSAKGTTEQPGKNVRQKAGLNRAVLDASFAEFRRQLQYKLAWHGGRVVVVPPAWTSQRCSCCGSLNDPGKSEIYACAACGLRIDRDLNAARNILAAASCTEAQNARGAGVRPARRSSPGGQSALKREQRRKVVSHY
jgi:putative transposase